MSPVKRRLQIEHAEISSMEDTLGKMLSIRQANPEFIQTLKHRLTYVPSVEVEIRRRYKALWVLAAALFSGGLIIFIFSLIFGRSGKA